MAKREQMPIEIAVLLGTVQLAKAVGELTGVIESVGVKIDRLTASELQAGLRALDQAQHATREHDSLLREARARLNKAVSLEKGPELVVAFLALAVTHRQLGDIANTSRVLREFLNVDFKSPLAHAIVGNSDETSVLPSVVRLAAVISFPVPTIPAIAWAGTKLAVEEQIDQIKNEIRKYLAGDELIITK
jgi:hypothetical protein